MIKWTWVTHSGLSTSLEGMGLGRIGGWWIGHLCLPHWDKAKRGCFLGLPSHICIMGKWLYASHKVMQSDHIPNHDKACFFLTGPCSSHEYSPSYEFFAFDSFHCYKVCNPISFFVQNLLIRYPFFSITTFVSSSRIQRFWNIDHVINYLIIWLIIL